MWKPLFPQVLSTQSHFFERVSLGLAELVLDFEKGFAFLFLDIDLCIELAADRLVGNDQVAVK